MAETADSGGARARVAVVGGGTLGLYVAGLLAREADVEVLEADLPDHAALLGDADLGAHRGATEGWASTLGGTSTIWGGQLLPWEPWEVAGGHGRPAWEIPFAEIAPGYGRVLRDLGLPAAHARVHAEGIGGELAVPSGETLTSRYSTWMRPVHRDMSRNRAIRRALEGVPVRRHTRVRSVAREGARLAVETVTPDGREVTGKFDAVVLAAGTLGTTRLLATAVDGAPAARVGEGFMDHVSYRVAEYEIGDWRRFRRLASHAYVGGVRATHKLVTTPGFAAGAGILPGYAHWELDLAPLKEDRSPAALARTGWEVATAVADGAASRRRPVPRGVRAYLRVDVEQPPQPDRRLEWSDGESPGLTLRWDASEREHESARVIGREAAHHLEAVGIGAEPTRWLEDDPGTDTFHLMGGAAMAADPGAGVVDTWGEVWGAPGVWVAGAATFPSGGVANPTFTALALAARTADRILAGLR